MQSDDEFLNAQNYLTDDDKGALVKADLVRATAFRHMRIDLLVAPPFSLSHGKASMLLDAAGAAAEAAHPRVAKRREMDNLLAAVRTDPTLGGELADAGVLHLVLDDDGKPDKQKTHGLKAHLDQGAPLPITWQGSPVVEARTYGRQPLFCSPRTGKPLQDGCDELSGVPWVDLKLEGLRLCAFGFAESMFAGMTDQAILDAMKGGGKLRSRVAARSTAVKLEDFDKVVVYRSPSTPSKGAEHFSDAPLTGKTGLGGLVELFLRCFSADELRRFFAFGPDGESLAASLPAGVSHDHLAFECASIAKRRGLANAGMRDRLILARPRRADEIRAVFESLGVH